MHRLHENYYLRKNYFKNKEIPTQSVIKKIMGTNLANAYFKSMRYDTEVLVGLQPPLQGKGSEWYMPPKEVLAGRYVLNPIKLSELKMLACKGVEKFGERVKNMHYKEMQAEKMKMIRENDENWKRKTLKANVKRYEECGTKEAAKNLRKLHNGLEQFELLYRQSITKIEEMMLDAARTEINRIRTDAYQYMQERYEDLLKGQATMMYKEHENRVNKLKEDSKNEFIRNVENLRTLMGNSIHDINLDKHFAIEKLRCFFECQNLACQVYVALKEREECQKEVDALKKSHDAKVKDLKDDMAVKNFEIKLEMQQKEERINFINTWKKKVCLIVKKFQTLIEFSLKEMPQYAEHFLNMEKLMMLQISEVIENPTAPSIIEPESIYQPPVPQPHPFYLYFDKSYKPQFKSTLCPEHRTSSASLIPVTVINKRLIYSACDKYSTFIDNVEQYLTGLRGKDEDVYDGHNYELDYPVKMTSSQQLLQLKLESSFMQFLQKEIPNVQEMPLECEKCKRPYCFCSSPPNEILSPYEYRFDLEPDPYNFQKVPDPGKPISKTDVLKFLREPKWESYFEFIKSKQCRCAVTAKKHLEENMPVYMRKMSPYAAPEIPNYEMCDLWTMKVLVKRSRGVVAPPPPPPKTPSRTRNVATQYSDQEFELLCDCFDDKELDNICKHITSDIKSKQLDIASDIDRDYLSKSVASFTTDLAYSIRHLVRDPSIEEIFQQATCLNFN